MTWNWAALDATLNDLVITVGIGFLVVRQFLWRAAEAHRMLRLPAVVLAAGLVSLVLDVLAGSRWATGDWFLAGEFALVAVTGTVMGAATRFRLAGGRLQYRLTTAGLWLWAAFVVIRLGSFLLAARFGANLAGATGVILLSFGLNRLAAIMVVRRRARRLLPASPDPSATAVPA
jgi:hypothetical protein